MGRVRIWLGILWQVVVAVLGAAAHRIRFGPLVPGWGWGIELRRAVIAAFVRAGMKSEQPERWADLRIEAPLPRHLRGVVDVHQGTVGAVPGEWLRLVGLPDGRPLLVYLHGGGHVVGHPGMERPFIAELVAACRADCFSVDYRLAPRFPFPAALDDSVAALEALVAQGIDPRSVVLVGDSAGGNLAVATLLRLRDEGGPIPAGAVLFSPWLDLANTGETLVSNAPTDYLPPMAGTHATLYLGPTDPTDPYASPLYADLGGLPPMLVLAGAVEMLLDDSRRFAERARQAGADVTLHVEPRMFHVWPAVIPAHPASQRAIHMAGEWVGRLVPIA